MVRIRGIHFNAQTETASAEIPNLLIKPSQLGGMLSLPESLRSLESTASERSAADQTTPNWTTETAARFYLQTLLENQDSERLAEITSPERPELIPDMRLERAEEMQLIASQNVSFIQTARSIPIFGTRSVVEIDPSTRRLIAVDGIVSEVPENPVSAIPELGVPQAIEKLSEHVKTQIANLPEFKIPVLCFYPETSGPNLEPSGLTNTIWRLAYHFHDIPVRPLDSVQAGSATALCCGISAPFALVPHDFLVDANSGEIIMSYASVSFLDVPVACTGTDVSGNPFAFDGIQLNATTFQLTDPLRRVDTCDAAFSDIAISTPAANVVKHSSPAFPVNAAAVGCTP